MKLKYGNLEIVCDRVTETDGMLSIWQGGEVIRQISNIPPNIEYRAIDGLIEHILTPFEEALEQINDLQADLAAAAVEIAEKTEQIRQDALNYMELLADDEAKAARLERITSLLSGLGGVLTLSKLIEFVNGLREILSETGDTDGED